MADLFALGNQVDQLPGAVLGVGGHKADAEIPLQRLDAAQQVGEGDRLAQSLAIGVDVLAQQQNLLVAHRQNLPCLPHNLVRFTADLPPAHIGHDAVGAEIVAAVHDLQRSLYAAAALDGQPLGDGVLPALSLIAVDYAPLALEQAVDHLWQGVQHMGAENQLDKGVAAANLLHHLLLLHHAAAQADDHGGIFLL